MKKILTIAFFLMSFHYISLAQGVKEYTIYKTSSPLNIDGKLSEPQWQKAKWTQNFVINTSASPAKTITKAKLLWDNKYLYIAFYCEDRCIIANYKKHDSPLWREDVVEVYLDPGGKGTNYIEFDTNPLGTVTDILLDKPYYEGGHANYKWNLKNAKVGIHIAGTINNQKDVDTSWICELALPFSSIKESGSQAVFPPKNSEAWRINLYRYDYYFKNKVEHSEITAWNPTYSSTFHIPDKFGKVIFSTQYILAHNAVKK